MRITDPSPPPQDFISNLLLVDTTKRLTAEQAKSHPWLLASAESLEAHDLCDNLQTFKVFNAKRKLRAAMKTVRHPPPTAPYPPSFFAV